MGLFIRFISTDSRPFPATVKKLMEDIEEETRRHTPRVLTVNVCVGYGGQSEVAGACNRIIRRHPHNPVEVTTSDLRQEMLRSITQESHEEEDVCVFGSGQTQEPQLIIRTSGEMRLSNFLLYECAYSELTFLPKTWPEMSKEDLYGALRDYSHRLRRTGK